MAAGFRVEVELADRSVQTFEVFSASNVQECVRMFTERDGEGLTFDQHSTGKRFSWTWDEIDAVTVRILR